MIGDLLSMVVVLGLVVWLISRLMEVEAAASRVRRRVRQAKANHVRLKDQIGRFGDDRQRLEQELKELERQSAELKQEHAGAKQALEQALALKRPRLVVLSDRRNNGDKAFVVTLALPTLAELDRSHPHLKEWLDGRPYLVFAKTSTDAHDRALRRFSAKPGVVVKSVVPMPELAPTPPAASA